ncbi:hypothetical protein [Holospora elegans]|uniref:hypothetical protein n=1 Tax=Holospora elegans TaxID=431043 RepID=UPI00139F2C2B|nr:hypothetical protein [Holospora elegans]
MKDSPDAARAEMLGALERIGVRYKKSPRHPKVEVEKQGIFYQKIQGASKGRAPHRFH